MENKKEIIVSNVNGTLTVSSLQVAKDFEKRPSDVNEAIEKLTAEKSAVKNMFIEATYINERGRQYKCYDLTRDGFSLLVMGFTGKKALEWKLKYIEAFNKMEQTIIKQYTELESLEIQAKANRAMAMRMNAENRRLKLLLSNEAWKDISDVALQTMGIKTVETVTGQNLGNLLPEYEKTYSATEVCKIFNNVTNPCTLGKRAKALGLQTDDKQYGIWVMDKSPYSTKEVRAFRYNSNGIKVLADSFGVDNYNIA